MFCFSLSLLSLLFFLSRRLMCLGAVGQVDSVCTPSSVPASPLTRMIIIDKFSYVSYSTAQPDRHSLKLLPGLVYSGASTSLINYFQVSGRFFFQVYGTEEWSAYTYYQGHKSASGNAYTSAPAKALCVLGRRGAASAYKCAGRGGNMSRYLDGPVAATASCHYFPLLSITFRSCVRRSDKKKGTISGTTPCMLNLNA